MPYEVLVKMETPQTRGLDGEVDQAHVVYNPGDTVNKADLGKTQSPDQIEQLIADGVIKEV